MTAERWQQVKRVLDEAIALEIAERQPYLERTCGTDRELLKEVASLLSSHEQAGAGFLKNPAIDLKSAAAAPASRSGRRIGIYQIGDEIGHGGMGEVYRAVRADGQYRKEVAVKLVRGGFDSAVVLERFRNERQILATLDHPNIARLLDGGTSDDGIPYLVMELIEGERIDTYCDQRLLSIRERLELFRQVCAAVQYAHQRLVIHRDIKPSNLLVTKEGVPKLLDFGIAKILDPAADAEITVARPMTPEYASPEQVRGEPITTASDVYSLGVVLYQLLTGRSPYPAETRSPHELARAVCESEPDRPSSVVLKPVPAVRDEQPKQQPSEQACKSRALSQAKRRRRLTGDLDDIVLMALRKEPVRRYTSVEQFAEDIRRHLEGQPVAASKGSWSYRAGKFVHRNKIGMAATAIVLFAVLGGVGATAREARIASENQRRAEKRFNDVRKLANSMIFELHDSIQDLPGATGARKLIVERGLEYLDSLVQESRGDASLQRDLADAYQRIGDVQGAPFAANLGDAAMALKSYEKSLAIRQALLATNSGSVNDALGRAEVLRLMGSVLTVSGDTSRGLNVTRQAVQTLEAVLPTESQNPRVLQEMMRDYGAQADILASYLSVSNLGDVASALPLRRRQLAIAEQLSALDPRNAEMHASSLGLMGDQLLLAGQRREASEYYARALQMFEGLAAGSASTKLLFDLHDAYYRLMPVQLADGQMERALASARRALEVARKLSVADPQNSQAQLVLAADYANLADVVSRFGKQREAQSAMERALSIDAKLAKRYPRNAEFRHMRSQRLQIGGYILHRFRHYPQALRDYKETLDLLLGMKREDPSNRGVHLLLALAYNGIGLAQNRLLDFPAAATAFHQALDVLSTEMASKAASEDVIYATANAYAGLGDAEAHRGAAAGGSLPTRRAHLRQALVWYDLSLKSWGRVKEPGLVSPSGYDCTALTVVTARRVRLSAQLAKSRAVRD